MPEHDFVIRQLADELRDLKRRLAALETAPRAPKTSVRDGFTRWLPEDGGEDPKLYIGKRDDGGVGLSLTDDTGNGFVFIGSNAGDADVALFNDEGSDAASPVYVFRMFGGRLLGPLIPCAWQSDHSHTVDTFGRPIITGGTYERVWTAYLPIGSGSIAGNIFVNVGAGITSAAVRIRATLHAGGVSGGTQTVVEQTGITASGFLTGSPWTIPDSIRSPAASPVGVLVLLELEGRVTGGAGNLAVAPTQPVVNWPV